MAKKIRLALILVLLLVFPAFAHHPAEDMLDEELYAEIELMLADTPHLLMEDDDIAQMIIDVADMGSVDDLIADGLLDDVSLLDGEVTVTITFPEVVEEPSLLKSVEELSGKTNGPNANFDKKWSEWGRPVRIHILQVKPQ